jgi:hypothetical protein
VTEEQSVLEEKPIELPATEEINIPEITPPLEVICNPEEIPATVELTISKSEAPPADQQ